MMISFYSHKGHYAVGAIDHRTGSPLNRQNWQRVKLGNRIYESADCQGVLFEMHISAIDFKLN